MRAKSESVTDGPGEHEVTIAPDGLGCTTSRPDGESAAARIGLPRRSVGSSLGEAFTEQRLAEPFFVRSDIVRPGGVWRPRGSKRTVSS